MTDDELYEFLSEQIDDLGDEGVLVLPEDCTDEQYERVLARIKEDMEADAEE